MKRAAHHFSNLTPLLNFVRISKWFELQQRAWWQMKALDTFFFNPMILKGIMPYSLKVSVYL